MACTAGSSLRLRWASCWRPRAAAVAGAAGDDGHPERRPSRDGADRSLGWPNAVRAGPEPGIRRLLRLAPRPDGAHRCRRAPDQPPPRRPLRATPSRHYCRPGLHLTGGGSRFGWPYEPAVSLGHLDTARSDPGRRTLRVGARVTPRPRVLWARHDNQWRCLSARWPSSGPVAAGTLGRAGRRRPALPGRAGRSAPVAGGGIGWVGGGSSGSRHLSRRTRVICSSPTPS